MIVYVYEASDAQTLVTQCGAPPPSPYGGGRPFPQVHKGGGQYSLLDIVYVDPYIYMISYIHKNMRQICLKIVKFVSQGRRWFDNTIDRQSFAR